MSDYLLKKIQKKEQRKAYLGCFWCILFLLAFWGIIIWKIVDIAFPVK